jgi:hypothetical protein
MWAFGSRVMGTQVQFFSPEVCHELNMFLSQDLFTKKEFGDGKEELQYVKACLFFKVKTHELSLYPVSILLPLLA